MTVALYGLPEKVIFCKRCVISNQRPNSTVEFRHTTGSKKATIHLDAEGICDACRVAESKAAIDWSEREAALGALLDKYRSRNGSYDCIVPGSGGKDSFYAAHMLKYRYGMNPLTVTWAPHIYTEWGWRNFQSWIHAGFDNILTTPNGLTHRILTRLAVENLFHPFQPFVVGQKALAPKMSALHRIPLVFYGENEAEYGNPIDDTVKAQRDASYYTADVDAHLSGVPFYELRERYQLDLEPYMPASANSLARAGTEVHYLGYYLRWHPQSAYYYAVEHGGFVPSDERQAGTYSKYNSIDDKIDDFHYFCTFVKFGIGRATYDAAQEVRSGDITRAEAVALVSRYDGEWPGRWSDEIFRYLSPPGFEPMTEASFMALSDKFRSPHLWDGRILRHRVEM